MDSGLRTPSIAVETGAVITPELFLWSSGRIVLLGEASAGGWVVARGWHRSDELTDIRRWSFTSPRAFAGQIRRLSHEVTGDRTHAARLGDMALGWSATALPHG